MRLAFAPQFAGYRNYIQRRYDFRPLGVDGVPFDNVCLEDSWQFVRKAQGSEEHKGSLEIVFPDGDSAYLKQIGMMKERGVYVLCDEIGFKIVPDTDIAHIPVNLKLPPAPCFHYSIQEGVKGPDLDAVSSRQLGQILQDTERLEELYVFSMLTAEAERFDRHVILNEKTGRINSIDHEWIANRNVVMDWPGKLAPFVKGDRSLSSESLDKLKEMLKREKDIRQKLTPYFKDGSIDDFFSCARFLVENPRIIHPNDKNKEFLNWKAARSQKPVCRFLEYGRGVLLNSEKV